MDNIFGLMWSLPVIFILASAFGILLRVIGRGQERQARSIMVQTLSDMGTCGLIIGLLAAIGFIFMVLMFS